MELERQFGEGSDEVTDGPLGVTIRPQLRVVRVEQPAIVVRETGGMGQDVLHRDRPRGLDQLVGRAQVLVGVRHRRDLHLGELGQVLRDRIAELEPALFVQGHQRHGSDRLGHRRDPEDRVPGHRGALFGPAFALGLEVDDLAAAGNQADCAGDLLAVDVAGHRFGQTLQALGRHAGALGLGDRQRSWRGLVGGRSRRSGRQGAGEEACEKERGGGQHRDTVALVEVHGAPPLECGGGRRGLGVQRLARGVRVVVCRSPSRM